MEVSQKGTLNLAVVILANGLATSSAVYLLVEIGKTLAAANMPYRIQSKKNIYKKRSLLIWTVQIDVT